MYEVQDLLLLSCDNQSELSLQKRKSAIWLVTRFSYIQKMSEFLVIRFEGKDKELLQQVCRARRESVSDFVRRTTMRELAKLSYLSDSEKKALEVQKR